MQRVNVGKFLAANMFVWGEYSFSAQAASDPLTSGRDYCSLHCICSELCWPHGSSGPSGCMRMYHLSHVPPFDRAMVHLTRAYNAFHHMGNCKCWYAGHRKSHQLRYWVPGSEASWWTCTLARNFNISGVPYYYLLCTCLLHFGYAT